ncbi:DUF2911 domain-containing protein [Fulvivirgaceae bacterium BMA12]|uniref:DUF2911 domain-containing protein n=1 Tax=Agaribacillus aureus TaxID=3051825 RepID=A0ABT8LA29_9BACT|nr:DUF2911 domain-containing protein [Fulvivirgaceae bacterium BMA12]
MKRPILLILGVVVALITGYVVYSMTNTKRHSPEGEASYDKDGLAINVSYCRPYKKGRLLFGEPGSSALEVYGQPWRTGANEATEISVSKDLVFREGILKAGKYSIYTIPGEKDWVIVFNSKLDYWGASLSGSPFDPSLDVLRVTVPRQKNTATQEQFTIDFADGEGNVKMLLLWDDIKIEVPMLVQG